MPWLKEWLRMHTKTYEEKEKSEIWKMSVWKVTTDKPVWNQSRGKATNKKIYKEIQSNRSHKKKPVQIFWIDIALFISTSERMLLLSAMSKLKM